MYNYGSPIFIFKVLIIIQKRGKLDRVYQNIKNFCLRQAKTKNTTLKSKYFWKTYNYGETTKITLLLDPWGSVPSAASRTGEGSEDRVKLLLAQYFRLTRSTVQHHRGQSTVRPDGQRAASISRLLSFSNSLEPCSELGSRMGDKRSDIPRCVQLSNLS